MKRFFLLMLTNLLVIVTLGITWSILSTFFGLGNYVEAYGLNLKYLAVLSFFWGMGGAFISLAMSKFMAKMMTGAQVIDPATATGDARWLVQTVHRLAERAGITSMPEVAIYPGLEINAFATGPTKNSALVAVSEGILRHMSKEELEGVLGHEISHASNGDMVTMTLVQGVINAFVMFASRILAWVVSSAMGGDRDRDRGPNPMVHMLLVIVFDIAFSALGMIVVAWFSRQREFRADAGGARLVGKSKMIAALQALQDSFRMRQPQDKAEPALATLKISGAKTSIFSTHPDLEERIQALRAMPAAL